MVMKNYILHCHLNNYVQIYRFTFSPYPLTAACDQEPECCEKNQQIDGLEASVFLLECENTKEKRHYDAAAAGHRHHRNER